MTGQRAASPKLCICGHEQEDHLALVDQPEGTGPCVECERARCQVFVDRNSPDAWRHQ